MSSLFEIINHIKALRIGSLPRMCFTQIILPKEAQKK